MSKTAKQVLATQLNSSEAFVEFIDNISATSVIQAMRAYGRECAEQALKDAADNTYALNDPSSYQIEQSILSTPIVTP